MDENIHDCRPGADPPGRKDVYLIGNDRGELSIKTRGESEGNDDNKASLGCSDVEVKGLVEVNWGVLNFPFLTGPVEFWCKWPFPCMDMGKTRKCELKKIRWLRKFDTSTAYPVEIPLGPDERPIDEPWSKCPPILGCNVELTEIRVSGCRKWFSFCFETFGDQRTIADDLRAVVTVLSGRGGFPDIRSGLCLNYPSWISHYVTSISPS